MQREAQRLEKVSPCSTLTCRACRAAARQGALAPSQSLALSIFLSLCASVPLARLDAASEKAFWQESPASEKALRQESQTAAKKKNKKRKRKGPSLEVAFSLEDCDCPALAAAIREFRVAETVSCLGGGGRR